MHRVNKFLFLAFVVLFMCFPIASASTVAFFSRDWTYGAYAIIYPGAMDIVGQTAYFGTHVTFGPPFTNYLYAVDITNGSRIWQYNTSLPVNYVSNFTYNNSTYIIAGTGDPSLPTQGGYVLARSQENVTLWNSTNLGSSVQSLGAAEGYVSNSDDVVAGLANGQAVRLSGSNGSKQWNYDCDGNMTTGNVPNIAQLNNGSVAVGTSSLTTGQSYIHCLQKDGALAWNYTSKVNNPLRLTERFGNLDEVVAALTDDIDVLNGTTGAEIAPWPFNATQHIAPFNATQPVADLLCAEDYTGNGFPDIVAGTDTGFLMIINGQNATLFRGPVKVAVNALAYLQYMDYYENGSTYSNKTLAVSIQNSTNTYYVIGINASKLTIMKQYQVSSTARNLLNIDDHSSNFTGDLLFSENNIVYCLSGTAIIAPEFPSQIMLVIVIVTLWISIVISRRHKSRIK